MSMEELRQKVELERRKAIQQFMNERLTGHSFIRIESLYALPAGATYSEDLVLAPIFPEDKHTGMKLTYTGTEPLKEDIVVLIWRNIGCLGQSVAYIGEKGLKPGRRLKADEGTPLMEEMMMPGEVVCLWISTSE